MDRRNTLHQAVCLAGSAFLIALAAGVASFAKADEPKDMLLHTRIESDGRPAVANPALICIEEPLDG